MTAGLVTLVVGLAVGAAALGGPAAGQVPRAQPDACAGAEDWEADAQALADELAGAPGPDAQALRQELADAGFEAGGSPGGTGASPQPPPSGDRSWPDALVQLVLAVIAALDGNGDGEVPVTVLESSGDAPVVPRSGGSATDPDCADPPDSAPAPRSEPAPPSDPAPRSDADADRPERDEAGADSPGRGEGGADVPGGRGDPPAGSDRESTGGESTGGRSTEAGE